MDFNLAFINHLVHACTRGIDSIDCMPEGVLLLVNLSKQVSRTSLNRHSIKAFLSGGEGG